MSTSLKNVHCIHKTCNATFMTLVCTQSWRTENFLVCLQLFEAIWKTAANPGEFFISLVQKKYGGGGGGGGWCTLPHEI